MQNVPLEELLKQGNKSASSGEPWHFHVVKDACELLERDAEVLFVLEHGNPGVALCASGIKTDIAKIAVLAELLHGVSTAASEDVDDTASLDIAPDLQHILDQAIQLTEQRIAWHHHVLFPDCVLNKNAGSWCVLIEGNGTALSAMTATEPTDLLRRLEPLFYSQSAV